MTPQDISQHAQTCFNPLIAFFPAYVDKLLNALRMATMNLFTSAPGWFSLFCYYTVVNLL
jgi:hypothetical protein